MMLIFSVFLFLVTLHVLANPVPTSSTDLSTDGEDSYTVDPDDLADSGCTKKSASIEPSDEGIDADLGIFRRQPLQQKEPTGYCPATGWKPPWRKDTRPPWKAPEVLPLIGPADRSVGVGFTYEICKNPVKAIHVSCAGPEIWYETFLGYVMNCVPGSAQTIQARKPFPEADKTNEYCCHSLMNDNPFYAAYMCEELILREIPIMWNAGDFNQWVDGGMKPEVLFDHQNRKYR